MPYTHNSKIDIRIIMNVTKIIKMIMKQNVLLHIYNKYNAHTVMQLWISNVHTLFVTILSEEPFGETNSNKWF